MAVWINIQNIKTDVLYGLFIGQGWIDRVTKEEGKRWDLHFYQSEKSRRGGLIYQKREHPSADFLAFEIKAIDLIQSAKRATVIPKEIHVRNEELRTTRPWVKGKKK